MLSVLIQVDCDIAIELTPKSVRIGDERPVMSTLREEKVRPTLRVRNDCASITLLCETVTASPLEYKLYAKGSPSQAWVILEGWKGL